MNTHNNQSGFVHVIVILIAVVILAVIGLTGYKLSNKKPILYTAANAQTNAAASKVKIKSLPIEIDTYNASTGKAGEVVFPKESFAEGSQDMIFMAYGFNISATSNAQRQDKANPQPTFLAPIGTKVRALIDGEVIAIPNLYSKDFSIHMQGKGSDLIFETEHVINVSVKVGDKVKAGTPIAEVSNYDVRNYAGLGLVEIGVLNGSAGNLPMHLCTFDFLDDSIKAATLKKITQLENDWETFRGNPDLYGTEATPGCVNNAPITDNNNSQTGTTNN